MSTSASSTPLRGPTCGIDIGGTKIAGAVVDEQGRVLAEARVESPAADTEAVEDAVASLVTRLAAEHEVGAVGIGAAGYVDAGRSVVMFAPNIAWRDEDLRTEIESRVGLPVGVENDANAAAASSGAASGSESAHAAATTANARSALGSAAAAASTSTSMSAVTVSGTVTVSTTRSKVNRALFNAVFSSSSAASQRAAGNGRNE